MKRKIIEIDKEKCNGCGLCVDACHEGAIQMVDGKAQLISDKYCDGLGDCLPACPVNAIKITEREAEAYDQEAVEEFQKKKGQKVHESPVHFGCPGMRARKIEKSDTENQNKNLSQNIQTQEGTKAASELQQWPVQLRLVHPRADYLDGADILIAADCTAFAYGNFHKDFIKGRVTLIGCPKLDDNNYNTEKLTEILTHNNIRSITVVKMEVPCCNGIVSAVRESMLRSQTIVPYSEVTIGIDGEIL